MTDIKKHVADLLRQLHMPTVRGSYQQMADQARWIMNNIFLNF